MLLAHSNPHYEHHTNAKKLFAKSPLIPFATPFIDQRTDAGLRVLFIWDASFEKVSWAISSAVEHFVDIEGVTSSILVSPTMNSLSLWGKCNRRTRAAK